MFDEYNSATIYSLAPLSNGKVLVGGNFTTVGGEEHPTLVRLNSDGAPDASFTSPTDFHTIKSTCLQEDGSIWAGGIEASNSRNPLILLFHDNGPADLVLQSNYQAAHAGGVVSTLLCDTNGLSWAGGKFSLIDNHPFYGLARYLLLSSRVYLPLALR